MPTPNDRIILVMDLDIAQEVLIALTDRLTTVEATAVDPNPIIALIGERQRRRILDPLAMLEAALGESFRFGHEAGDPH